MPGRNNPMRTKPRYSSPGISCRRKGFVPLVGEAIQNAKRRYDMELWMGILVNLILAGGNVVTMLFIGLNWPNIFGTAFCFGCSCCLFGLFMADKF